MKQSMFTQMKSAICKNTSHQWDEWILDDSICSTTRRCKRCGAEETRKVDHIWSEWTLDSHICSTTRKCKHCGVEESLKTDHHWSEWSTVVNQCVQIRMCAHCGMDEKKDIAHIWGEWKYTKEYNCDNGSKVRECENCHQTQISYKAKHKWGEWKHVEKCIIERECQNCGRKESVIEHSWGEWVYDDKCLSTRKCKLCDKMEMGKEHLWKEWHDDKCVHYMKCELCGLTTPLDVSHEYELIDKTWDHDTKMGSGDDYWSYYRCTYKCKRCGDVKTEME